MRTLENTLWVLGDPTLPSVGRRKRKGPGFSKNTQIITRNHMPSIITTLGGGPKTTPDPLQTQSQTHWPPCQDWWMIFKGYLCASVCVRLLCLQGGWVGGLGGGWLFTWLVRWCMFGGYPQCSCRVFWSASLGPKIHSRKLIVGSGNTRHKTLEYMCRYIPYRNNIETLLLNNKVDGVDKYDKPEYQQSCLSLFLFTSS